MRILIAGGPKCGKTTFAATLGLAVRHTDDLIGTMSWSDVSDHVASRWMMLPGEWWGKGIQRGYGLDEKRFSLFNVHRWGDSESRPACCGVVPILGKLDKFSSPFIDIAIQRLKEFGSKAAPGFMNPEGVVIYHKASGQLFKATLKNDEKHKGEN